MLNNNDAPVRKKISRIAILNPYLQGGHTQTAEIESATRFINTAETMGIETRVLASSDEVERFDPDFVIPITYQEPKLTAYPTYGLLTMPVPWVKDIPRFVRNILSYDGYLTVSNSTRKWLRELNIEYNKQIYIAYAAFSIRETPYIPCDFTNATAVYIGTNWDKSRHQDLFMYLSDGQYLKCFGPRHSWEKYPQSLYGGEIAFDGTSTLSIYNQYAAGLCINHRDFDNEGVPSSRTFEIAASGAIPICTPNEYTENIFGDSVLYIDNTTTPIELAEQISEAIKWIRMNPKIASNMAKEAHHIFCTQISMDIFLKNIIEMHNEVMQVKGFTKLNQPVYQSIKSTTASIQEDQPTVVYFVIVRDSIKDFDLAINYLNQQSYSNIQVIVICCEQVKNAIAASSDDSVEFIDIDDNELNNRIQKTLQFKNATWFGFFTPGSILFSNHVTSILNSLADELNLPLKNIAGVFSGSLYHSDTLYLDDDLKDDHSIQNKVKLKIGHFQYDKSSTANDAPLSAYLFNFAYFNKKLYHFDYLGMILDKRKIRELYNASWLSVPDITSSNDIERN